MEARRTARSTDWWVYVVFAFALAQLALFLVLRVRPGMIGVMLWYVGPVGLSLVTLVLIVAAVVWSARRRPFWTPSRGVGYLIAVVIMLVSGTAYRVYPSSFDGAPSQVEFRVPLDGAVTVAWGGPTREVNYHAVHPDQRWAYDLLVTEDGNSHRGTGDRLEDYYAYGWPVLAPAAGTVRAVLDGEPDSPVGRRRGPTRVAGNHVVLEVAPNEFLFVNHLQPGTLSVRVGDGVNAGQELGRVGNSGSSSEPHVHIHLQSAPRLHLAEGIPLYFHCYRQGGNLVRRGMPTGGMENDSFVGHVVEHVPACRPDR